MPLAPQLSLIGVSADDEEHFSFSGADPVQGGLLISTIALMWQNMKHTMCFYVVLETCVRQIFGD